MKQGFTKYTLLFLVAGFAIICSSFKNETLKNTLKKENITKSSNSFQGTFNVSIVGSDATGTGSASHIGGFTFAATFSPSSTYTDLTGTMTFTAGNGDQIHTSIDNGFINFSSGEMITINCTIIGGTGRFASASGSFTMIATIGHTNTGGNGNGTLNGVINR